MSIAFIMRSFGYLYKCVSPSLIFDLLDAAIALVGVAVMMWGRCWF